MQIGWGWGWGLDLGSVTDGETNGNREVNLTQNLQMNQISMDCLREKGNHVFFPIKNAGFLEIYTANSEHSTFDVV